MNIDKLYLEIGQNIKAARQIVKLSQAELATKLGLKRTSITNIENGKQRLPLHLLYEICELLNVDALKVLPGTQREKRKMIVSIDGGDEYQISEDSVGKINKYLSKAKLENVLHH
ncbi:MAG: helix-turn-helix transcriptional regulator [Bacteriovoracaceae bacterium]|jgi:transcriptional regulator with XRE-family HTH domain|nr:helix-turn-helix transcriptional regulator [Bacteriovoracaceae bacterium]